MSNYTKDNLLNIAPSDISAGTLAIKIGNEVFTAGNVVTDYDINANIDSLNVELSQLTGKESITANAEEIQDFNNELDTINNELSTIKGE